MHSQSQSSEFAGDGPAVAAVPDELGSHESDGDSSLDASGTGWENVSPRHPKLTSRFDNDDPFEDLFWRWD